MIRLATLSLLLALTLPAAAQIAGAQVPAPTARSPTASPRYAPLSQRATGPTLKPAVTVVGEIVRIGDLVENAGAAANVAIFRAPDLGQTGRVAVERVDRGGAAARDRRPRHPRSRPRSWSRARAPRITAEGHRDAHHAGARRPAAQHRREQSHAHLRQRSPHASTSSRARELRIARLTFDPRSGRFDVLFERPGRRATSLRFTGTYAETFEAAVLTRPLAAGEVVRAVRRHHRAAPEDGVRRQRHHHRGAGDRPRRAPRDAAGRRAAPDRSRQARGGRPQRQRHHHLRGARHHADHARQGARRRRAGRHHQRAQRAVQALDPGDRRRPRPCGRGRDRAASASPPTTTAPRLAAQTTGRSNPTPQTRASAE